MRKKVHAAFLLALCTFALPAEEYKLINDAENDISLNSESGLLSIRRFGGIKPQNVLLLGEDIFTTKQMEGKAAATVWKNSGNENGNITLTTNLKEKIAGPDLDGVEYTKTFKFIPSVPEIQVTMAFRNTTGQLRYAYWGVRNQFQQRSNFGEVAFIPRTTGTFPHGGWMFLQHYSQPPAWASSTAENWCAKLDPEGKTGLAFLLDNASHGAHYTNKGQNIGFMFDGGYLLPGASVSATYAVRPLKQLGGVTTINESFAALIADSGAKIQLSVFPYEDGTLSGEFEVIDKNRKSVFKKTIELNIRKGILAKFSVDHPRMSDHSAVVFTGTVNGRKFATEQYCENGIRMQSVASNPFMPYFTRPALERKDSGNAVGMGKERKLQAICLFGLYTPFNRFDRILDGWKIDYYSVWNTGMKEIPPASTLDEYSVMIISNAFVFGMEVCLQRVKNFVAKGGILIVTGGPSAFGTGAYEKNPILKEILPVAGRPYDLQPAAGREQFDKGIAITGIGINPAKSPHVYWLHHFAKLKPSTEVLWKAGNNPVLVKNSYGKGKVLCFLGSPLGDPQDGTTAYWESEEYVKAMRDVITVALKEVKK